MWKIPFISRTEREKPANGFSLLSRIREKNLKSVFSHLSRTRLIKCFPFISQTSDYLKIPSCNLKNLMISWRQRFGECWNERNTGTGIMIKRFMISGRNVWAKISLKTLHIKTYFLKSLHFGYFKICEPKWVTKMEWIGLQEFQKPLSAK